MMARSMSTLGSMLKRADEPANDVSPNHMTLDDLQGHLDACREKIERAKAELEARIADYSEAEAEFVERIRPSLVQHDIVAREVERDSEG